jgi:hypothetical protein
MRMLDEDPVLRPFRFGVHIDTLVGLPHTRQPAQWAEIGECIRRDIVGFGEDVGGNWRHGSTS